MSVESFQLVSRGRIYIFLGAFPVANVLLEDCCLPEAPSKLPHIGVSFTFPHCQQEINFSSKLLHLFLSAVKLVREGGHGDTRQRGAF